MRTTPQLGVLLFGSLSLAACGGGGGGGGGSAAPASPTTLTGVFTDSPVEGLSYRTATQSGVTDAAGTFRYRAGESVTFSLGGTTLGEAAAGAATLTPRDLVPGVVLYTSAAEYIADFESPDPSPEHAKSHAFQSLINLLVLLQSLDEDGVPGNGIRIQAGAAALLDGIQLDFDTDSRSFSLGPLRALLHEAKSAGFVSTTAPKQAGTALEHFYASRNISVTLRRLKTRETDYSINGPGIDTTVTYDYDPAGHLSQRSTDEDGDTVPNNRQSWAYNSNGNLLEFMDERLNPQETLQRDAWEYDDDGRDTGFTRDYAPIGAPADYAEVREFNTRGYLTLLRIDQDGDGVFEVSFTWLIDDQNFVTDFYSIDPNESPPEFRDHFDYDDEGRQVLMTRTLPPYDGLPVFSVVWGYAESAAGSEKTESYDSDGNGSIEADTGDSVFTRFFYDQNGLETEQRFDNNADGTADWFAFFEYTLDGQLTDYRHGPGNGDWDYIATTIYLPSGKLSQELVDSDGNGVWDYTSQRLYHPETGKLVELRYTYEEDQPDPNVIELYGYDDDGNLSSKLAHEYGSVTRTTYADYDAGKPTLTSIDDGNDGTVDTTIIETYETGSWTSLLAELENDPT